MIVPSVILCIVVETHGLFKIKDNLRMKVYRDLKI